MITIFCGDITSFEIKNNLTVYMHEALESPVANIVTVGEE